jgi:hypothetical protein
VKKLLMAASLAGVVLAGAAPAASAGCYDWGARHWYSSGWWWGHACMHDVYHAYGPPRSNYYSGRPPTVVHVYHAPSGSVVVHHHY